VTRDLQSGGGIAFSRENEGAWPLWRGGGRSDIVVASPRGARKRAHRFRCAPAWRIGSVGNAPRGRADRYGEASFSFQNSML
jgi:hypothetical protein